MKYQALFSLKDKSKNLKCCLLQFLFGALRVKVDSNAHRGSNSTSFASIVSIDHFLKQSICSSMSKFFPLRVGPMSKSYPIYRSKQEYMQVNIALFL